MKKSVINDGHLDESTPINVVQSRIDSMNELEDVLLSKPTEAGEQRGAQELQLH